MLGIGFALQMTTVTNSKAVLKVLPLSHYIGKINFFGGWERVAGIGTSVERRKSTKSQS